MLIKEFKDCLLLCKERCVYICVFSFFFFSFFFLCLRSKGGSQMYMKVTLVVRIATRNVRANFHYYLPLKMFYRS